MLNFKNSDKTRTLFVDKHVSVESVSECDDVVQFAEVDIGPREGMWCQSWVRRHEAQVVVVGQWRDLLDERVQHHVRRQPADYHLRAPIVRSTGDETRDQRLDQRRITGQQQIADYYVSWTPTSLVYQIYQIRISYFIKKKVFVCFFDIFLLNFLINSNKLIWQLGR